MGMTSWDSSWRTESWLLAFLFVARSKWYTIPVVYHWFPRMPSRTFKVGDISTALSLARKSGVKDVHVNKALYKKEQSPPGQSHHEFGDKRKIKCSSKPWTFGNPIAIATSIVSSATLSNSVVEIKFAFWNVLLIPDPNFFSFFVTSVRSLKLLEILLLIKIRDTFFCEFSQ